MALNLNQFIGRNQLKVMRDMCKGEEGEHFTAKIQEVKNIIANMPVTYEADGQGDNALVSLHYFTPSSDWWVIERDCEEDQEQAFGFVCINGWTDDAELGYISIVELLQHGAELDLYWNVKPLGKVKQELYKKAA